MSWQDLADVARWVFWFLIGYHAGAAWSKLMRARCLRRPCERHQVAGGEAQPVNGFRCQRCKRYITWREISE